MAYLYLECMYILYYDQQLCDGLLLSLGCVRYELYSKSIPHERKKGPQDNMLVQSFCFTTQLESGDRRKRTMT